MNRLISLLYFVLSLLGLDVGSQSFEHRTAADGADVLLSRAHVDAGVARFECVQSASGECHYLVLPKACDADAASVPGAADCGAPPIARFTLAQGESRQIPGLQNFRLCVGVVLDDAGSDCRPPTSPSRSDG